MDTIHFLIHFVLHLDEHLVTFVTAYGMWTYVLLFLIIFCETGIILIAFLPGDSLLFAAGALAAAVPDVLNVHLLLASLIVASILGNSLNYFIGKQLGSKLFRSNQSLLFNKKHIDHAHHYFERYGGKTIVIARFLPILRTFAPFVAGIGYMTYQPFLFYTVIGAFLWIGTLIYSSYLFGNIPFVKEHFSIVIVAIVVISILPALFEILRRRYFKTTESPRKKTISIEKPLS